MGGADEPVKQSKPEEMLQYMMEEVGFTEVPAAPEVHFTTSYTSGSTAAKPGRRQGFSARD